MLQDIRRYFRHGTLPQLHLFEAAARLGSLRRAAEELHMAQPTASVQMRKLTETIGVPLFEQVGKRLYLTDAGRRLQQSCQDVFGAFRSLDAALSSMRALSPGGCGSRSAQPEWASRRACLRPLSSGIRRRDFVQAHNRQRLVERLAGNEDDLYLFADAPDMEDVVAQQLLPNPLVVLARDDHVLAHERNVPARAAR